MDSRSVHPDVVDLDTTTPIWHRVFMVAPLVVIGTRDEDGRDDLAPKHMALPLGWQNYFGFVCTPRHATYRNVAREGVFTVSFPHPSSIVVSSLTASPRCDDSTKPILDALPLVPAKTVPGVLMEDSYLFLECELHRIIDEFEPNSLISGVIRRAAVRKDSLRLFDRDDGEMIASQPLLAFLAPERYAVIEDTRRFPFPAGIRY